MNNIALTHALTEQEREIVLSALLSENLYVSGTNEVLLELIDGFTHAVEVVLR